MDRTGNRLIYEHQSTGLFIHSHKLDNFFVFGKDFRLKKTAGIVNLSDFQVGIQFFNMLDYKLSGLLFG